jgi:hypothetical protein
MVDSMPSPRAYPGSAVLVDLWLVAGGVSSSSSASAPPLVSLDPTTAHWQMPSSIDASGSWLPSAVDVEGGRVLFVSQSSAIPGRDDAFLGDGTTWVTSRLATPRDGHAVAFAGVKFIVSGGWGNYPNPSAGGLDPGPTSIQMPAADAETLAPGTGTWVTAGVMPGGPRIWTA